MKKINIEDKVKYYFYALILFTIVWIIFVPKPLKNYSPIFFMFSSGVLFFLYFDGVMNISNSIKIKYPELFKKYESRHDLVDVYSLIGNDDYDKMNDDEIKLKIKLIKQFLKLSIVSFVLSIIFGILIVNL